VSAVVRQDTPRRAAPSFSTVVGLGRGNPTVTRLLDESPLMSLGALEPQVGT
jgi:hypothetical protein